MVGDILVRNVDFDLLYEQLLALLQIKDNDTVAGVVNLLEYMLDRAEEEGYFQFPEEGI